MTDALGLAEKVNKFNQQALKHLESQTLNPFSGRFSRSPSPRPRFSKDEYGKPKAGSLTDLRGQKAFIHISREILDLCNLIHDVGSRKKERGEYECDEEDDDGQIIMTFGELFAIYSKISDKVVGLLIAAKKRGFVYFEPEILFQRRDDDVLIALMKPIEEIRSIIDRQLSASPCPAAMTASQEEQSESSKSPEQPDEAQTSQQSCTDPSVNENQTQPTAELPTVKEEQVPSCLLVTIDTPNNADETSSCNPETDPSRRKGSVSLPPKDNTPLSASILETSINNQEPTSPHNSGPLSDNRTEELTSNPSASELPSNSVEDTPLSPNVADPSNNKDEPCSHPVTEPSTTNNEEQILGTPEPSGNKDEPCNQSVIDTSTTNKEEQTLGTPEPSSNKDEPATNSSTKNEDQTLATPQPSDKSEQTMLYPSVTAPSSDKGEQTLS